MKVKSDKLPATEAPQPQDEKTETIDQIKKKYGYTTATASVSSPSFLYPFLQALPEDVISNWKEHISYFLLFMQEPSAASIAKTKLSENLKKLQVFSFSNYFLFLFFFFGEIF